MSACKLLKSYLERSKFLFYHSRNVPPHENFTLFQRSSKISAESQDCFFKNDFLNGIWTPSGSPVEHTLGCKDTYCARAGAALSSIFHWNWKWPQLLLWACYHSWPSQPQVIWLYITWISKILPWYLVVLQLLLPENPPITY